MLFPSNHQDLATAPHRFRPNIHSLPHLRFPPCHRHLQRNFSPRFPSTFRSPSPDRGFPRLNRMASWALFQLSLPKPCWRTMKSQQTIILTCRHSVKSTPSCSRFSQDPPLSRSRCTPTHPDRLHPSWSRQCTHRLWQQAPLPWCRDTSQAQSRCRSCTRTRRRHSNRRVWPCSRNYSSYNTNSNHPHKSK